jgi:queuine/archaeosine tRNA-ribosyltransferase
MVFEFVFEIDGPERTTGARNGRFHTPHGISHIPVLAPVDAQVTVKVLHLSRETPKS